jgi:Lon protease-like protein
MSDHDFDLQDFSNVTRLFPLPHLVMFPHVLLPLHIFEPRYRQMTAEALAGDRLITVVQICPPPKGVSWTEPVPIEEVGCLGKIIQHERLPDGRFNLLLLGRNRVRLRRELPTDKLYRTAEVEILEDLPPTESEEPARTELKRLFGHLIEQQPGHDRDFAEMLENVEPLGALCDIVSHALSLPPSIKQQLLAEPSVDRRVETILSALRKLVATSAQPSFPPPFSTN